MWKGLQDDPETSKLLKKAYGSSQPHISYPKVQGIIPKSNLPQGVRADGSSEARDNKHVGGRKTRKAYSVPRFRGTKAEDPAPIDSIVVHRKREGKMREEQAINKERLDHYRPPYIRPIGEDEKRRLAEKFEYGGGKALPPEMVGPTMPIPSEERWKVSEAERVARVTRRRRGLPDVEVPDAGTKDTNDTPTTLYEQVANEVEERQKFLLEARASGIPYEHEARVMAEISSRLSELERLRTAS